MRRVPLLLSLTWCLPLGACRAADQPPRSSATASEYPTRETTYTTIGTRDGALRVDWRSDPTPIPIGEYFALDVILTRADNVPIQGATIYLLGFMPDHGHGMTSEPRSIELGGGRYRVPSILLHMEGHWEMTLSIVQGGQGHAADFILDL